MTARMLPREVAPGIHWLGQCQEGVANGAAFHQHFSAYVVVGPTATLMVDTGMPSAWDTIQRQLDAVLAGRDLNWLLPTHPELPHAGNLPRLAARYPNARIVGAVRDYHLAFPELADRLLILEEGESIDLGGGYRVIRVESVLRDLSNTAWTYEAKQLVLFTADGFIGAHQVPGIPDADDSIHLPGQCALTVTELAQAGGSIDFEKAALVLKLSLYWSRYRDSVPVFARLRTLLEQYPVRMIAPAHGNIIDDVDSALPTIEAMYHYANQTAMPVLGIADVAGRP